MQTDRVGASTHLTTFLKHPALWFAVGALTFIRVLLHAFPQCFTAAIGTLDYPIQIISAQRILGGERPYRDFQVLYGPLGHYVAAAFQWPLRHEEPAVAFHWYIYAAFLLFLGVACMRFARLRLARPLFLIGSVTLLLGCTKAIAPLAYYSLPMTLPVIAVIVLLPHTVSGPRARPGEILLWQIAIGILIAAELLIRINFGVYLIVAIFITGAAARFRGNRSIVMAALRSLIIAAVATVVLLVIFSIAGVAGPAIADMRDYLPRAASGRALPWRMNPNHELFWVTTAAVACLLLGAASRLRKGLIGFWLVPYLMLCAFFSYAVFRFDPVHLLPLLLISLLLLFESGENVAEKANVSQTSTIHWFGLPELQVLSLMLLFTQVAPLLLPSGMRRYMLAQQSPPPQPALPTEAGVVRHGVSILAREASMLDRLDQMRKPGEEIFWTSAQGSCQSTFDMCVNLTLYLADGVLPKQRIWFFDTASTPFADVQWSIVQGLEAAKTPWIGVQDVYVHDPRGIAHREAPLLQRFIESHYDLVFTSEIQDVNRRYSIYVRRPRA